jgi:hypothetical protein
MKQDSFLQSLQELRHVPMDDAIDMDVSRSVMRLLRERKQPPIAVRFALPAGVALACLVALVCGTAAVMALSSATDPMSAMVSSFPVQMQW